MAGVLIGFAVRAWLGSSSGLRTDAGGLPLGPVSYQFVNSRPPAHLVYPDAKTLRVIGHGESHYPAEGVTDSASAGAILATNDSPDQIYAWYDDRLKADGWKTYQLAALLSTQRSARGYQRGTREFFVVAIDDPRQFVVGSRVPVGGTLFEYTYTIEPSK
ncbi:MAG: hypothetical protein M3256_23030 [Actinomycetota bacterium]|nr:hypothetical protein [Actinomycetota bacterium]